MAAITLLVSIIYCTYVYELIHTTKTETKQFRNLKTRKK
jgi:hypothetical protein